MRFRVVIIDEPIHVENRQACELWRKALWAKEEGYRAHYKSGVLPLGTDDFFGSHLIIVDEKPNGAWEPVVMYKSVRRSQASRFKVPFGAETLLIGTPYENSPRLKEILSDTSEISYDSSWSINPDYKSNKELSSILRDYVTMFCCNFHTSMGFYRWLTAGVQRLKIDDYFAWLGCEEVHNSFQLPIIDNETVRMLYHPDTRNSSDEAKAVTQRYAQDWDNRIIFSPRRNKRMQSAA
jgi:hypothetical protein